MGKTYRANEVATRTSSKKAIARAQLIRELRHAKRSYVEAKR